MGKKRKRNVLRPPGPTHFALRETGKVIPFWRWEGIARLLDMAIELWFYEKDPLSIHVLALAAYQCLEDLGKKSRLGPMLKAKFGAEKFNTYYDFLRHGSSNPLTGIDFPPSINGPIIFDALASFQRIFRMLTVNMRAFIAYFVLHSGDGEFAGLRSQPDKLLPKGLTVEDAAKLGRIESFHRIAEMFAVQSDRGGPHIDLP